MFSIFIMLLINKLFYIIRIVKKTYLSKLKQLIKLIRFERYLIFYLDSITIYQ